MNKELVQERINYFKKSAQEYSKRAMINFTTAGSGAVATFLELEYFPIGTSSFPKEAIVTSTLAVTIIGVGATILRII